MLRWSADSDADDEEIYEDVEGCEYMGYVYPYIVSQCNWCMGWGSPSEVEFSRGIERRIPEVDDNLVSKASPHASKRRPNWTEELLQNDVDEYI